MTDNEIKKTEDTEVIKIKAIYPHIVVGGTIDKPCYSIDWYDIEAQTMHTGYSSYNLKNVQEWLKEHFEVVEYDIENLINRLQAEIKDLQKVVVDDYASEYDNKIKAEAYKEFADRLCQKFQKEINELEEKVRNLERAYYGTKNSYLEFEINRTRDEIVTLEFAKQYTGDLLEEIVGYVEERHGCWVDDKGNRVKFDKTGFPECSCYCSLCHSLLRGVGDCLEISRCSNCGATMDKPDESEVTERGN